MQSLTPVGLIITEARRKREPPFTVASRKLTPDPSQAEAIVFTIFAPVFTIFAPGRGAARRAPESPASSALRRGGASQGRMASIQRRAQPSRPLGAAPDAP